MFSPKQNHSPSNRLSMQQLKNDLRDFKSDLEEFKSSEPFRIYGHSNANRETKKMINYLDMNIDKCNDRPNPFKEKVQSCKN